MALEGLDKENLELLRTQFKDAGLDLAVECRGVGWHYSDFAYWVSAVGGRNICIAQDGAAAVLISRLIDIGRALLDEKLEAR